MRAIALLFLSAAAFAQGPVPEAPRTADEELEVTLFAAEPMIQQPIGCAIDAQGRLLVIESHTHFRPKDWQGPEHDQIVMLLDTDGDGRADSRQVIFDQTDMTMDIATHPDGSIYLATRNEILRLKDDDGDGKPESVQRKLVWMESEGRYPHNGLSGLAFDAKGNLYFGMGENLGAPYTLMGSDGSSHSDEGEGGNIWHVTKDGGNLRRVATGFWNPFGVCVDSWGNVFATDNDPDASPPCRLQHIIQGGDYGYQFRYGRTGLHPFTSWNGERLGTLPMLAGTGEAPCDVIFYRGEPHSQYRGLGPHWAGTLMVASWVDHRVECYKLMPDKGSFAAQRQVLLQGGVDFKPVAMTAAADGTLFVTDWVKRGYELHGLGRVWRVRAKQPKAVEAMLAQPYPQNPDTDLRERIESGPAPTRAEALQWLAQTAPFLRAATIERLSREPELVRELAVQLLPEPEQRGSLLLAARRGMEREGTWQDVTPLMKRLLDRSLREADPQVVLLALHWISDARVAAYKGALEMVLKDQTLSPPLFYATLTALARLESEKATENDLVKRLKEVMSDPKSDPARVRMAVQILPGVDRFMMPAEVRTLIGKAEPDLAEWLTHVLGLMHDPARLPLVAALAADAGMPAGVREAARLYDESPIRQVTFASNRPAFADIEGWKRFLKAVPGEPDVANGRRVFLSPKLGGCAACHRMEGLGSTAGPNLAQVKQSAAPDYVLQSILQPNANVAPQFESFSITTTDGQNRTAFQLHERGGVHTYIDLSGKTFQVKIEEIARRDRLPVSIMPEGIVARLTDVEVRDLLAYLELAE
jgi:putative membrane-bound dehydrogenase-like protein